MQRLLLRLTSFAVGLYYRRVELGGQVPSEGPVVLVGNHPNGLVDPITLAATAAPRPLRFLAKAPLFKLPVLGWIMRGMGALPVYRAQDGANTADNASTFEAVHRALAEGELVALFPEGKSHDEPELQSLKTGAARMALGAERMREGLGVTIVPVGLLYRAKRRFRSPVTTWIGEALEIGDLVELHKTDERAAVRALTDRIAEGLAKVVVTLDRWEDLPLLELAEGSMPRDERTRVERLKALAEGLHELRQQEPERAEALTLRVASFHDRLERLGIPVADLGLEYRPRRVLRFMARNAVAFLVGLPLAFLGALLWVLPYRFVPWLTRRIGPSRDIHATVQILAGSAIFPLWTLLLAGAAAWALGGLFGALALVAVPGLGLLALSIFDYRRAVLEDIRVFLRVAGRSGLRARLLRERDAIAGEILTIREARASRT